MVHIPVYERQVLNNRQIFGENPIGKFLGGGDSTSTTTSATNTNTRAGALPATETSTSQTSTSTSSTSTSTSSTTTSTTSTSVTSTSTSTSLTPTTTTTSTSSVPSTTSTSSTLSTSTTPAPAPITSTTGGRTLTSFVTSSTESPSPSGLTAAGASQTGSSQGFWENKAAVGVVFGIVGLVGLGLLIFIISLIVRRVRQKRLVEDAVSFNPSDLLDHRSTHNVSRMNSRSSTEKAPYYGSDSGHSNYGNGGIAPTYAATYDYNGPAYDYNNQGYDQGYSNQGGYYASQQQQGYPGYGNANPVQLPSRNMQQQNRVPSPLLPTMNVPNEENALGSGGSAFLGQNPPGIQQMQQGASVQRAPSATGTIVENPYLSTKGFKVTNV